VVYGAINSYRRFVVEENPNQSGILISYTGALEVMIWDKSRGDWVKPVETVTTLPGQLTLQQVYVEKPNSGDYIIQIAHNRYSNNAEPRRYTLMTYDKLGADKVFFSENYDLLVAPQRSPRLRAAAEEAWQDDYWVSFTLHFDQEAVSETTLQLDNPDAQLEKLTNYLFDFQTPEFVKKQLQRVTRSWRENGWQARYLDLLALYFDYYGQSGWLNLDKVVNIKAQMAALLPYLASD
jgi:hypothetical protein